MTRGRYEVLADQDGADVTPTALTGITHGYRHRISWDGTGWADAHIDLTGAEPTQALVAVGRLTAERIALVLTGVPLPA